jgi:inosine/xanthosine triphosphate pyrophosphatase family protein
VGHPGFTRHAGRESLARMSATSPSCSTELAGVPPTSGRPASPVRTVCTGSRRGRRSRRSIVREGACRGTLRDTVAGGGGFGYDPLFVPDPQELLPQDFAESRRGLTFAELPLPRRTGCRTAPAPSPRCSRTSTMQLRVGKVIA